MTSRAVVSPVMKMMAGMAPADVLHHGHAVHDRHLYVGHNHVERLLLQQFQPLPAVGGGGHFVTAYHLLQAALQDEA